MLKPQSVKELRGAVRVFRTALSSLIIVLAIIGLMLFPIAVFGTDEDMRIITNFLFGV